MFVRARQRGNSACTAGPCSGSGETSPVVPNCLGGPLQSLNRFEQAVFKLVTLRCPHQTAPPYLAEEFHQSSAEEARQRLRSASTSSLVVTRTRRSSIGDRAFPVAAARLWNTVTVTVGIVNVCF